MYREAERIEDERTVAKSAGFCFGVKRAVERCTNR